MKRQSAEFSRNQRIIASTLGVGIGLSALIGCTSYPSNTNSKTSSVSASAYPKDNGSLSPEAPVIESLPTDQSVNPDTGGGYSKCRVDSDNLWQTTPSSLTIASLRKYASVLHVSADKIIDGSYGPVQCAIDITGADLKNLDNYVSAGDHGSLCLAVDVAPSQKPIVDNKSYFNVEAICPAN